MVEADEDSCESSAAQGIERGGAVAREFGVDSGSSPYLVRAAGRLVAVAGQRGRRRQEGDDAWLMQRVSERHGDGTVPHGVDGIRRRRAELTASRPVSDETEWTLSIQ